MQHGNAPRAVLMKGLHPLINGTIDLWHRAVLRAAFVAGNASAAGKPTLDVGCGYGRLAGTAGECGLNPVVGMDFTEAFCSDFRRNHGDAVCGELSHLPFRDGSFRAAYAVTALMYLDLRKAVEALREIDRCLVPDSSVLLVEPSFEFNRMVRTLLRKKGSESLARPGFSLSEMTQEFSIDGWTPVALGGSTWLTLSLPLLVVCAKLPFVYRQLEALVLALDRPGRNPSLRRTKLAMYRWILFRKGPVGF